MDCGNDNTSADLYITGKQAEKHSYHKKCIPVAFISLHGSDKVFNITQSVSTLELCLLCQQMTSLVFYRTVALLCPLSLCVQGCSGCRVQLSLGVSSLFGVTFSVGEKPLTKVSRMQNWGSLRSLVFKNITICQ